MVLTLCALVHCPSQPALLKLLASLGAGFDCASKAELEAVLALGVDKDRIIFAHPCKRACDLRFARDAGIQVGSLWALPEARMQQPFPGAALSVCPAHNPTISLG